MIYKAYLNQGANGCDYTIGCGETVIDIEADSMHEAKIKLVEEIRENYSHEERQLESAEIFEISNIDSIDVNELYEMIYIEKKMLSDKEMRAREFEQYTILKKKFES